MLPLTEPALADRYGVTPPKAVIPFGPPGTAKTSFGKAVASRLDRPFVELFPSRLAAAGAGGLATSLREAFADPAELETVLLGNHSGARPALADQAPDLVFQLSGWRDLNPRPLRPE